MTSKTAGERVDLCAQIVIRNEFWGVFTVQISSDNAVEKSDHSSKIESCEKFYVSEYSDLKQLQSVILQCKWSRVMSKIYMKMSAGEGFIFGKKNQINESSSSRGESNRIKVISNQKCKSKKNSIQ